jgi:hypothetical protein
MSRKRFAFCFYVDETDRQAMIVNEAIARAWIAALKRESDNQRVCADLQAALFAAVVVECFFGPATDAHGQAKIRRNAR